jgi:hypothetical protein
VLWIVADGGWFSWWLLHRDRSFEPVARTNACYLDHLNLDNFRKFWVAAIRGNYHAPYTVTVIGSEMGRWHQ